MSNEMSKKRESQKQPKRSGYRGGQKVSPGHYWNLSTGELAMIRSEGEALPGMPARRFLRTPPFVVVFLGPLVGSLYVLVLPFLGFAILAEALVVQMGRLLGKLGVTTALAQFLAGARWVPGRAYLMGWAARHRPPGPEKPTPGKAPTGLERLESEVTERRERGEK